MTRPTEDTLEGTWEEIVGESASLSGKRVRLTVLSDSGEVRRNGAPPFPLGSSLADAMTGLTGVVHSREQGREPESPLSEDESSFPAYLEQKRREGTL